MIHDVITPGFCREGRMRAFVDGACGVAGADTVEIRFRDTVEHRREVSIAEIEDELRRGPDFDVFTACGAYGTLGALSAPQCCRPWSTNRSLRIAVPLPQLGRCGDVARTPYCQINPSCLSPPTFDGRGRRRRERCCAWPFPRAPRCRNPRSTLSPPASSPSWSAGDRPLPDLRQRHQRPAPDRGLGDLPRDRHAPDGGWRALPLGGGDRRAQRRDRRPPRQLPAAAVGAVPGRRAAGGGGRRARHPPCRVRHRAPRHRRRPGPRGAGRLPATRGGQPPRPAGRGLADGGGGHGLHRARAADGPRPPRRGERLQ